MIMRIISFLILITFLNSLFGCTSTTKVFTHKINPRPKSAISRVILNTGESIAFDKDGGRLDYERRIISGFVKDETLYGTLIEIELKDIREIHFKDFSALKTTLLGATVMAVGLMALFGIPFYGVNE